MARDSVQIKTEMLQRVDRPIFIPTHEMHHKSRMQPKRDMTLLLNLPAESLTLMTLDPTVLM